jgi:hypothetical protein
MRTIQRFIGAMADAVHEQIQGRTRQPSTTAGQDTP